MLKVLGIDILCRALIVLLVDEFLQPVDASVGRSGDMESPNEASKSTICVVRHGSWRLL